MLGSCEVSYSQNKSNEILQELSTGILLNERQEDVFSGL